MMKAPRTLIEAVKFFSDKDICLAFVAKLRWPKGVECPRCCHKEVSFLKTRKLWKCKSCKKQFSIKLETIFEDSPIGLDKWLPALWMVVNCKNGISSYEMARALGVTQKTAWFMTHRIRLAMQAENPNKIDGEVEVDETFIGGRARFMHKDKRTQRIQGRGPMGKTAVMGLLDRHSPDKGHSIVQTKVIASTKRRELQPEIRQRVEPGTELFTDSLPSYGGLTDAYIHNVIDHAACYAEGAVHTNGLENFWSLLKRSIRGTYVSVEPFHFLRYLDEQSFRFNNRKLSDSGRFMGVLNSIFGRRVTYGDLIGETY